MLNAILWPDDDAFTSKALANSTAAASNTDPPSMYKIVLNFIKNLEFYFNVVYFNGFIEFINFDFEITRYGYCIGIYIPV